ncbi:MAG: hypothetical protein ABIS59_02355 [Candidatus Saccharibacteria bacterium]
MPTPNQPDGEHIQYHKDGTIWAKGAFKDGKMHGQWEWYRKDGTVMRAGEMRNNKQVGDWTTFAADGRVVKVTNFGAAQ